ncbi:MAG: hypothetical protein J1F11_07680 [Oscillospiraceae bacterium]|nr:hypothetical protein [Oscillospiraceae bacterium]
MANIQYIGNDSSKSENGKIHVWNGDKTGCGALIADNREDWKATDEPVTCERNGCKNH